MSHRKRNRCGTVLFTGLYNMCNNRVQFSRALYVKVREIYVNNVLLRPPHTLAYSANECPTFWEILVYVRVSYHSFVTRLAYVGWTLCMLTVVGHSLDNRCVLSTFVGKTLHVCMRCLSLLLDSSYTLSIRSSFVGHSSYTPGVRYRNTFWPRI